MDIESLHSTFQAFEDLFTEVSVKDFTTRDEEAVFLGCKNVRNMVEAALDALSVSSKPSQRDREKAKGILAGAIKLTTALLGQIKDLPKVSKKVGLLQHALGTALKHQSDLLKTL